MLLPQALNGVGGAMSLHAVSSDEVLLQDCTLLNNTAREGGALYIHTTSTRVHLDNCTAAGNRAVGDTSKNTSFEEYASHHGGALSMSGSVSRLHMWSCRFHANTAQGQVGLVFESIFASIWLACGGALAGLSGPDLVAPGTYPELQSWCPISRPWVLQIVQWLLEDTRHIDAVSVAQLAISCCQAIFTKLTNLRCSPAGRSYISFRGRFGARWHDQQYGCANATRHHVQQQHRCSQRRCYLRRKGAP
jgi:hypothetical protein